MTLKEYISNPAGKGDSSLNRAATISMLNEKYENLIKEKTIKVRSYRKLGGRNEYYIHLTIPSESKNRDNTYDVAFYFYTDAEHPASDIKNYQIKCFANTPSFAYTFLYVYYNEGLFIDCLKDKFDDVFFDAEPETRNKYKIVNYDKYLYFGAKYILESHLLNKAVLELRSVNYTEKIFKYHIRNFDKIMNQYRRAKNKGKHNEKESSDNKTKRRQVSKDGKIQPVPKKTSNVKTKKTAKKSAVKTPVRVSKK